MRRTYRSLSEAAGGTPSQVGQGAPRPRRVGNRPSSSSCRTSGGPWTRPSPSSSSRNTTSSSAPSAGFLRSPGYSASSNSPFYFGASDTASRSRRNTIRRPWRWSRRRNDRPAELRLRFLSWWDYGSRPWTAGSIRRRGQLPERIRARGTVHHLPERDRGGLAHGDPLLEGDMKRHRPTSAPRRGDPDGSRPPGRRLPQRDPPTCGLHLPRPLPIRSVRRLGPGHAAQNAHTCS